MLQSGWWPFPADAADGEGSPGPQKQPPTTAEDAQLSILRALPARNPPAESPMSADDVLDASRSENEQGTVQMSRDDALLGDRTETLRGSPATSAADPIMVQLNEHMKRAHHITRLTMHAAEETLTAKLENVLSDEQKARSKAETLIHDRLNKLETQSLRALSRGVVSDFCAQISRDVLTQKEFLLKLAELIPSMLMQIETLHFRVDSLTKSKTHHMALNSSTASEINEVGARAKLQRTEVNTAGSGQRTSIGDRTHENASADKSQDQREQTNNSVEFDSASSGQSNPIVGKINESAAAQESFFIADKIHDVRAQIKAQRAEVDWLKQWLQVNTSGRRGVLEDCDEVATMQTHIEVLRTEVDLLKGSNRRVSDDEGDLVKVSSRRVSDDEVADLLFAVQAQVDSLRAEVDLLKSVPQSNAGSKSDVCNDKTVDMFLAIQSQAKILRSEIDSLKDAHQKVDSKRTFLAEDSEPFRMVQTQCAELPKIMYVELGKIKDYIKMRYQDLVTDMLSLRMHAEFTAVRSGFVAIAVSQCTHEEKSQMFKSLKSREAALISKQGEEKAKAAMAPSTSTLPTAPVAAPVKESASAPIAEPVGKPVELYFSQEKTSLEISADRKGVFKL